MNHTARVLFHSRGNAIAALRSSSIGSDFSLSFHFGSFLASGSMDVPLPLHKLSFPYANETDPVCASTKYVWLSIISSRLSL